MTDISIFSVANSASNKECRTNYKCDSWNFLNCHCYVNLNTTWIPL